MATVTRTVFHGIPALTLSDGRVEAVVVPEWSARIVRFGAVGGANWLWSAPEGRKFPPGEWANRGGDKVWPALQGAWGEFSEKGSWPPHPTWDGIQYQADIVGEAIRLRGPVFKGYGILAQREISLTASGELQVTSTFKKQKGNPCLTAVWHVTQVVPPAAVFFLASPDSAYKNGYHWFGGKMPPEARVTSPGGKLIRVPPTYGGYKLGADLRSIQFASVRDGVAFVQRAARLDGEYPEGAPGAGFPFTLYNGGSDHPEDAYVELETLSPLMTMKVGQTLSHTVFWRLENLPAKDADSPESLRALERILSETR